MDNLTKQKVISEYLSGKGSTKISKELKIHKYKILEILKRENITRKRDRCKTLDIREENGKYYVTRICPMCKNEIKTFSKVKVIACRNHFNKIKGTSLCKKCSLKLQVGEGNPFYNKKHSKITKKKISNSRKGKCVGDNNPMAKNEWKEKAKNNLIKKWKSGDLEETRKFMSEKLKETRRLGKLKSVITSKPEKIISKTINELGYETKTSYKIDTKICDIYVPFLNLIIEYNGDYWHCNPKKYEENYFNQKKSKTAKEIWDYDSKRVELIKNYGYNLEVIWESDFKNDNKIINIILDKYAKSN